MTGSATPLDVAVIGCGAIANEHLPYLSTSPFVRLVAVCDTSQATVAFAQERFGAERCFTDGLEMLAVVQPDVVHVLTPPQTHKFFIERCLRADAHVICEKPLASTASDAAELLAEARERGKVVVESRNLLYNDVVQTLDQMVAGHRLGVIREVDVLLSLDLTAGPFGDLNLSGPGVALPGGAVHDFLPHLAYLFLHFAGQDGPVEDVTGSMRNVSGNARVAYDHLDALVRVGGCRGRLRIASDVKPDVFRLIVRGSRGMAEADFYNPFIRFQGIADSGKRAPLEQISSGLHLAASGLRTFRDKALQHGPYHGLPRMLEAVYRALVTGGEPPIVASDVLATAVLVDRLLELREP